MPELLLNIAIPLIGGGLSALLTKDNMSIYQEIIQPPLAPPSWAFPVAWTILYIMMGIAAYLVQKGSADKPEKTKSLRIYAAQLAVNLIWPILFFNLQAFLPAFIWLLLLIVLIIIMISRFNAINNKTKYLLIPYLAWCLFAAYLNGAIYLLNA